MINKKQEIREMYHYMAQLNERGATDTRSLRYGIFGQKENNTAGNCTETLVFPDRMSPGLRKMP